MVKKIIAHHDCFTIMVMESWILFFKAPWAAVYAMTNIDLLDSLMQIRSAASSLPRDLFVGTELLYEEWVFRYPVSFLSQA